MSAFSIRQRVIGSLLLSAWLASAPSVTAQDMPGMNMEHQKPASSCQSAKVLACADTASAVFSADGSLLLSWMQDKKLFFARSRDHGESWTLPLQLADATAGYDGGDVRPRMVADASGHVLIAYDSFKDQHWNAQIWLLSSDDGGVHFGPPVAFEPGASSQRLPVLIRESSGRIIMAWQDKRLSGPQHRPGASIAYALSDDGGHTFTPSAIAEESSCECCHIGAASGAGQPATLAFRAIFPGSVRDHVVLPFQVDGQAGRARRVAVDNWVTDACPHQGPALAYSGKGILHVVWFTQGKNRQGLFYARSSDGGQHFEAPQSLGNTETMNSRPDVHGLGNTVWRTWKEMDDHGSHIMLQSSLDNGQTWSAVRNIANATGTADHPLLVDDNKQVYLSWLSREHGYQLIPLKTGQ